MAILLLIVFIDLLGFGIVIPLLPYYALKFSASPFEVTALMACYSFAQFFASPIWGRMSDRMGRKPILLVSLGCSVLSYLWLGFAGQLWMLFAARLLAGAGAGNISAAQAYITDVTDEANRAKGMGMIGAAFGLGFTLGPAIGGLLAGSNASSATLSRPAFAAALLSVIALILAVIILKESLSPENRRQAAGPGRWALAQEAFGRPSLRHLIILFFLTTTAFAGMEATFALWANSGFGWGPQQVGELFFYIGIVLVLVQGGLVRPLSRSLGESRMALIGSVLLLLGLGGLPFSTDLPRLLIDMALLATGFGILNPAVTSLVSRAAGTTERGGILGVNQSGQSLARILGPLIGGAVYGAVGRDAPYYVGAVIMVAVVLMTATLPRGEKTR
ncbi:MAG TPA: MFS transporter [Stellaceae bacterium]|jgi:DHA1 family tetracycline resistance protein-like MFS transporter|nr:MFS transporter [Stellaceae bacterium]